ncbi:FecR family protein [Pseudomonas sp. LRF_L74]|uniref:FecR family protein n=1 Tax=Pseudomonas sp. LRF_L74 TaxID=3369422 RepID=UPI003F617634
MNSDNDDLMEQALEWHVLLQDIDVTDQQRRDAHAWHERSDAHRDAWQRAEDVWRRLDPLAEALSAPAVLPTVASRRRRWFRPALACAASLVLALVLIPTLDPAWHADYRTDIAQHGSWQLADGSRLELAADSALDVDYSDKQRRVRLLRGQAWFQVAADAGRPFIVSAEGGETRALGTAFAVRLGEDHVRVVVAEHSVQVSTMNQHQVVQQGQVIDYSHDRLSLRSDTLASNELAWRKQRLVFVRAPLSEVLGELQHYLPGYLRLTDGQLGQLPVTVVIDTRQPDKALSSLTEILPLRLTDVGPWLTLVRPAQTAK